MTFLRSTAASAALLCVIACDGARDTELDDLVSAGDVIRAPSDATDPPEGSAAAGSQSSAGSSGAGSGGGSKTGCAFRDDIDHDGDGLSFAAGDCNDCNAEIRPGRMDVPGNGVDEDCSGTADDERACESSLAIASSDPVDGARALGICPVAPSGAVEWGVVAARYLTPDGAPLPGAKAAIGHGILESFGVNKPSQGSAMLALSTGVARAAGQPGYQASPDGKDKDYVHGLPAGFPKVSPACPTTEPSAVGRDGVALELTVRVPLNAASLSFDHALFTSGYGDDVCTPFADVFAVIMSPPPQVVPALADGNVAFDALGGPIGVNGPFLQVCTPGSHAGVTFACGQGRAALAGTGYEKGGGTGWLRTTVPVTPGSTITLMFAVWDAADGLVDTTVLVDAVRFWTQPVTRVQTVAR